MTVISLRGNNVGVRGVAKDRALGDYWEKQFIEMAELFGWIGWQVTPIRGPTFMHNGRRYISPDVWLLRKSNRQYACEVKHKNPNRHGSYGLEEYRANGLVNLAQHYRNQHGRVIPLYVIHDWTENGDSLKEVNIIHHWRAQYFSLLQDHINGPYDGETYYNGEKVVLPINYYDAGMFDPLIEFLT